MLDFERRKKEVEKGFICVCKVKAHHREEILSSHVTKTSGNSCAWQRGFSAFLCCRLQNYRIFVTLKSLSPKLEGQKSVS
jgi:hypothetical protein